MRSSPRERGDLTSADRLLVGTQTPSRGHPEQEIFRYWFLLNLVELACWIQEISASPEIDDPLLPWDTLHPGGLPRGGGGIWWGSWDWGWSWSS